MEKRTADEVQQPEIFRLPPEVMHLIFSFCSGVELLTSVRYVCNLWHEILVTERFWRNKTLIIQDSDFVKTLQRVKNAHFVPRVAVINCQSHSNLVMVSSKFFPSLSLFKVHVPKTVDLSNLNNLSALVELDVSVEWQTCHYHSLLELQSISTIERVVLRRFFLRDYLAVHLIKNCPQLKHLIITKLDVVENYIFGNSQRYPESPLSLPSLKTLYIFGEQYLSIDILEAVGNINSLIHVVIKPTNYSIEELSSALASEQRNSLLTLDLGYASHVSDKFIQLVSFCNPNLRNLILTRCDVSDCAVEFIMKSLFKLEKLNLHGTRVTSARLMELALHLPHLKDLSLLACRRISHTQLVEMTVKFPHLLIELPRHGFLAGCQVKGRESSFLSFRNEIK